MGTSIADSVGHRRVLLLGRHPLHQSTIRSPSTGYVRSVGSLGVLAVAAAILGSACGSSTPSTTSVQSSAAESADTAANATPSETGKFSGTYDVVYSDGDTYVWIVTSCGSGCAGVSQQPRDGIASDIQGTAHLNGGQWVLEVSRPDAIECSGGDRHPGTSTFSWDAATLKGSFESRQSVDNCHDGLVVPAEPITLMKQS